MTMIKIGMINLLLYHVISWVKYLAISTQNLWGIWTCVAWEFHHQHYHISIYISSIVNPKLILCQVIKWHDTRQDRVTRCQGLLSPAQQLHLILIFVFTPPWLLTADTGHGTTLTAPTICVFVLCLLCQYEEGKIFGQKIQLNVHTCTVSAARQLWHGEAWSLMP